MAFQIDNFRSRKHDYRADKGKNHKYPKKRKQWDSIGICQRQSETNLNKYDGNRINNVMESRKHFKGSPTMRRYWRLKKAEQREQKAINEAKKNRR